MGTDVKPESDVVGGAPVDGVGGIVGHPAGVGACVEVPRGGGLYGLGLFDRAKELTQNVSEDAAQGIRERNIAADGHRLMLVKAPYFHISAVCVGAESRTEDSALPLRKDMLAIGVSRK